MKKYLRIAVFVLLGFSSRGLQAQNLGTDSNTVDYANPKQYEIAAIEVTGFTSRLLDENSLIARTGLSVGQIIAIPGDEMATAIKNLWRMRIFSSVNVYIDHVVGDKVWLTIRVAELPKISRYSPFGLSKSEFDDLRPKLDIVSGVTPYTDYVKINIENTIKDFFADKGFLNTRVEVYAKPDTIAPNSVVVYIDVYKGPKVRIETVAFTGNQNVSDRVLRKQMKDTKERTQFKPFYNDPEHPVTKKDFTPGGIVNILSSLSIENIEDFFSERLQVRVFNSSKFNEDKLQKDEKSVLDYYHSLGYRDAVMHRDTIQKVSDRDIAIEYSVEEGTRYYFRNIVWRGNTKYSSDTLSNLLGINKGDVYNQKLLEQRLTFDLNKPDITSLYMDDGYLFFQVTPVEIWAENDSIDLEIRIQEGPQATINKVIITGNTKTNENVIRRELRTLPGQKFNRSLIIRSEREIVNLQLFDQEQIGVNPIPHPENGTVDIEYSVVEKPSDQLELQAGFGGQGLGVLASVGIVLNNWSTSQMFKKGGWRPIPTGDGQKLSFRINTTGRLYQAYNIGFIEPWFGGKKPNSFSISLTRTQLGYNASGTDISDLEGVFRANGISLGYGIRLKWPDDYFTLYNFINYYNYNLNNYPYFITSTGIYNNFNIKETLERSSLDDPQFPKSGSDIALSLQFTPPYSLFNNKDYADLGDEGKFRYIEYYKWRFNADWYTPLFDKFVLRTSVKFGYLGYYNPVIGIPPFERFQLGGDGLSGGYTNTFVGTDIISLRGYDVFSSSNGSARTEPIFNKYTIEMRYPISRAQSATIYATLFAEGGNLWPDFKSFNPFNVKRTVGVGIRAWLPMFGLLGVDYGIRFDDVPPSYIEPAHGFFDYLTKNGKFTVVLGFEPE